MHGQIKIEYIFGIVFFAIIIFYLATQIGSAITGVASDSATDNIKVKANSVLKILIEDCGEPTNWEEKDLTEVKRIGLAISPYNLSIKKITKLNDTRVDDRCALMEKFDLDNYKLTIFNSTDKMLECGYTPPLVSVPILKPVFIEGSYGNVTLEVW